MKKLFSFITTLCAASGLLLISLNVSAVSNTSHTIFVPNWEQKPQTSVSSAPAPRVAKAKITTAPKKAVAPVRYMPRNTASMNGGDINYISVSSTDFPFLTEKISSKIKESWVIQFKDVYDRGKHESDLVGNIGMMLKAAFGDRKMTVIGQASTPWLTCEGKGWRCTSPKNWALSERRSVSAARILKDAPLNLAGRTKIGHAPYYINDGSKVIFEPNEGFIIAIE